MIARCAIAMAAALALAPPLSADPLALWTGGESEGAAELAPGVTVPARAHPCAACHGWDGSGGGEGAMRAPDLGRGALVARGYDAAAFAAALGQGRAADGRVLSRAMPRFDLPEASVAALWAFTAPLEERRRHGVTPDGIRLVLLHDPARPASAALVRAYETALDRLGGALWGRRLTVVPEPMARAAALAADPTVFAVIGPFASGTVPRAAFAAEQVPMFHGFGTLDAPGARVLPLGLGRDEEIEALLTAARDAGHGAVTILGGDPDSRTAAERLIRRLGMRIAGEGERAVHLVLSREADVPAGAPLALPEAVLLARPGVAAGHEVIAVPTLPFLAGATDPVMVYATTSLRILAAAIQDAGPDPTRASVADAAQRLRDALMEDM